MVIIIKETMYIVAGGTRFFENTDAGGQPQGGGRIQISKSPGVGIEQKSRIDL